MKTLLFITLLILPFLNYSQTNDLSINDNGSITRQQTGNTDLLPFAWGRYQDILPVNFGSGNYIINTSNANFVQIIFDEAVTDSLAILVTPTYYILSFDTKIRMSQVSLEHLPDNKTVNIYTFEPDGNQAKSGFSFVAFMKDNL